MRVGDVNVVRLVTKATQWFLETTVALLDRHVILAVLSVKDQILTVAVVVVS